MNTGWVRRRLLRPWVTRSSSARATTATAAASRHRHFEASEETKGCSGFPYGDFKKVNRAPALIHQRQRASQNDHVQIVKVAGDLLDRLDKRDD